MLEKITSFITGIMVAIGGFFTPTPVQDAPIEPAPIQEESFGAFSPVAGGTYRLKTSIGTSDTTIILSAFTEPITGNPLTMTSLATDIGYATIDPQSSTRKEFVSFTGITQNADGSATLTGVSRGLGFQSPFTASSTLRKSHPGQSIFILSDSPQLFNEYAIKRNNETITGQWTFTIFPVTPSSSPATATTSGVVELATGEEAASSTLTGDVGRLALGTNISTSSAPASGNVVVVTGDDGNIDSGFLPSYFTSDITFTGTTTGTGKFQIFTATTTSTWTKPTGAKFIRVIAIGGGGGGAGGSRGANIGAGGGGGSGGYSDVLFDASIATTSTIAVTVGGGGGGGAGRAGSDGNGISGTGGGNSSFGAFVLSTGGGGGVAGSGGGSGAGGTAGVGSIYNGVAGGTGGAASAAGATGATSVYFAPTGGGGGGGSLSNGGAGGGKVAVTQAGGVGGTSLDGGNGVALANTVGGTGGGGGKGVNGSIAGAGGRGALYGAGGGGGGSSTTTGGDGGSGADGIVIVITY